MDVSKYREVTKDTETSDELVRRRIEYIEALCRNVIRDELKKHVSREQ